MRREKNLEAAYNQHADMVMRICYLHLKNTEDVKDVLQEVFIKFISEEKVFKSGEREKAWLLRVAINKCKNIQTSFWRKNTQPIGEVEIAFNQNIELEVIEAVFNLRPKYKVPIHLHYYEGYSVLETARILNQKENTIYSNLHRARKELKEKLEVTFVKEHHKNAMDQIQAVQNFLNRFRPKLSKITKESFGIENMQDLLLLLL